MGISREEAQAEAYRRGLMDRRQSDAYEEAIKRNLVRPHATGGQLRFYETPYGNATYRDGMFEGDNFSLPLSQVRTYRPYRTQGPRAGKGPVALTAQERARPVATQAQANAARIATERNPLERFRDAAELGFESTLAGAGISNAIIANSEAPQDQREFMRAQRAKREARASADPWYASASPSEAIGKALPTLAGMLAGSGASPESWIGGPGKTVVTRSLGFGAVSALTDLPVQAIDINSGLRDRYDPLQTAASFVVGAALPVAAQGVVAGGRRVAELIGEGLDGSGVRNAGTRFVDAVGDRVASRAREGDAQSGRALYEPLGIVVDPAKKGGVSEVMADITSYGWGPAIGRYADSAFYKFYSGMVDKNEGLRRTVQVLNDMGNEGDLFGRELDLRVADDPYKLSRMVNDTYSTGHMDILHGVHDHRGTMARSPALADVIVSATGREVRGGEAFDLAAGRFDDYLVAKRGIDLWDRRARGELPNNPLSKSREELVAKQAELEASHPHFVEAAEGLNQYAQALLRKRRDAGLISQDDFDAALAANPFYVPFKRDLPDSPRVASTGASNKGKDLKRLGGSDLPILSPMEGLMRQTYELNRRIAINEVNKSLANIAMRAGPDNGLIRKVEVPATPTKFSGMEALKERVRQIERDPADRQALLDELENLTDGDWEGKVWSPGEINEAGKALFYVWRNGKKEAYELIDPVWGRDVYESLAGVPKAAKDDVIKVIDIGSSLLQRGITTNPEFMLANFVRDQITAWILTPKYTPIVDGIKGIGAEISQADVTRRYNLGAGIAGGANIAMLDKAYIKREVSALTKRGFKAKYFRDLNSVLELSEITETGTRLGVFQKAEARAKKDGLNDYEALMEASFAARDYIDFGRGGSRLTQTRKMVIFLNASIQGLDKTIRTISGDGARIPLKDILRPLFEKTPANVTPRDADKVRLAYAAWTKLSLITAFSVGLTALQWDDPAYQQVSEYTRANSWVFAQGEFTLIVPKPFELAIPANIMERMFEVSQGDDKAIARMVRGMIENTMVPTDVPAIKVPFELMANRVLATGQPIVPDSMRAMPADLQVTARSSEFSKALGGAINKSPAMIDHVVQGFGGSWGSWLLAASNATNPDRPEPTLSETPLAKRFVKDWWRGGTQARDFFELVGRSKGSYTKAANGYREYLANGETARAQAFFDQAKPGEQLYLVTQQKPASMKKLHPIARAQTVGLEIGRMRKELYGARVRDGGDELPDMDPRTKSVLDDALERLLAVEQRNALIAADVAGWNDKEPMDRAAMFEELRAVNAEAADELNARLQSGREKAYDYDTIMQLWPQVRARIQEDGVAAELEDFAEEAKSMSETFIDDDDDDDE